MEPDRRSVATRMLVRARRGDDSALAALMPIVYDELKSLAGTYLRHERPGHTLQPTALVHEAYLRLFDSQEVAGLERPHFLAIASGVMRRVLVEHARRKHAEKRGAGRVRVTLDADPAVSPAADADLLDLSDALDRLSSREERLGRVVEMRFFGGLSVDEVAEELGASKRTVEADWTFARSWLRRELGEP